jgi:hypothetical protein
MAVRPAACISSSRRSSSSLQGLFLFLAIFTTLVSGKIGNLGGDCRISPAGRECHLNDLIVFHNK